MHCCAARGLPGSANTSMPPSCTTSARLSQASGVCLALSLLQSDDDHDALVGRIATQLGLKAAGHGLHEGNTGITPHLASIGG